MFRPVYLLAMTIFAHWTGASQVVDFQQCDRECRWRFGRFYDRAVHGVRVGALGHNDSWGRFCTCSRDGVRLNRTTKIKRVSHKPWDAAEFWCGAGGGVGFNTTFVCVLDPMHPRGVRTSTRANASHFAETIVHCGKCAACSRPADVRVLYDTRHVITTEMTRCAAKFAKPNFLGGDHDLDHLRACLVSANITFDNTHRFDDGRNDGDGPTCMDCWTDNIMCDSTQCNTNPFCIEKFFNPNNTGAFSGCLKCDEEHCGAEFIRCAGANRRSSGILSDITRAGQEVCTKGFYWNCSKCHEACSKDNFTCHAKCDATESCRGPQGRQGEAQGRGVKTENNEEESHGEDEGVDNVVDDDVDDADANADDHLGGINRSPNILILLVDDMGYSDTAAFGSPNASTPHIDALVASGMKFTQWISAASICTPSRASLQTGRYPIRTGCMGNVEQFRVIPTPASPGGLDPRTETSLAAALKQRGYARTGYSGKWHLGINSNKIGAPQDHRFTPVAHGYDTYVGAPWTNAPMCEMDSDSGTSSKYKSGPKYCFLTRNDTVVEMPLRVENFTRTVTEHAVEFIAERAAARTAYIAAGETAPMPPWFFMMSWFHVHTPLFTNRTNRGRSKGGEFGDNVEEMDDSVGSIVGALEHHGFKNETIIFFTSDNGPYQEEGWDRSGRTNIVDGGGRLKGGKGQLYEGGVRMPGAVVWPGKIQAGAVSDTMVSSMDIFPTVVELAERGRGAVESDGVVPRDGRIIDGKSMLPVLTGATKQSQHDVFLHYCGFQIIAARVYGRWKVFWAMQKWYTNDPYNASICTQCCNGINPLSVPVTGAPATELCGCQDKDLTWLDSPVVFDMRHDRLEEHPLRNATSSWPADADGVTYADVITAANATRKRMMADIPAKPNKAGAGTCTQGIPSGSRQPCCPGCSEFTLLSKGCTHKGIFGKECTCG